MSSPVQIEEITGIARSVGNLLSSKDRYGLDYYQREYNWTKTQVGELIDDLAESFKNEFEPSHERRQVASYKPYFLGPIVTAKRDDVYFLVDGQQRVTTLSLLLIYLHNSFQRLDSTEAPDLGYLIYSTAFGSKTFKLDVEERRACLEALLAEKDYYVQESSESVRNLAEQYGTIEAKFADGVLPEGSLPYFSDYLQHRVMLVDIVAPNQEMALEIFETMNDRGLRLDSIDMLKSYLLARTGSDQTIKELNELWRTQVTKLSDIEKNADSDFVKAWLRGNYAETQRENKKGATNKDFELIGTSFHKWVRDNEEKLGLKEKGESVYETFVRHEFTNLSNRYLTLLQATQDLEPGFECIFYNAWLNFTLQLPVILAAITPDDDDAVFEEKARLVSSALEIFLVRRIVNYRYFRYSNAQYAMFILMKSIRNLPIEEVRYYLIGWLDRDTEKLQAFSDFDITSGGGNRKNVHYVLARISSWLEFELTGENKFMEYVDRSRRHPYEVEHIWANHFERHRHEFTDSTAFSRYRDRLGNLLLLPKSFNASYGDMEYADKFEHYNAQNPLTRSLHPMAYQNNPSFLGAIEKHGLSFKPYPDEFTKQSLDERQALYKQIAEIIWNPERVLGGD